MSSLSHSSSSSSHAATAELFISALASDDDGHSADFAIDGDPSDESRWSAKGEGQWLQLELTYPQTLCGVGIQFYKGDERQTMLAVDASMDGSSWQPVVSNTISTGGSNETEYFRFIPRLVQYLKITGYGNTSNDWTSLIEITGVTECEPTTGNSSSVSSTGVDEPAPTAEPNPVQPPSGDLKAFVPPSDNFNLNAWKLTLPVTEKYYFGSGAVSTVEILPGSNASSDVKPLNQGFEDSSYFYTDDDGAMVFRTPLTGGASTPNSSYVRSELRELYNWKEGDSSGEANWGYKGSHTLQARLRVSDYWQDDPQTVVGQIHAKESSKALLKLQWDGPNKPVRAIINNDPDSGNPFDLTFHTVSTGVFDYIINLTDTVLSITVDNETQTVEFGKNGMSTKWIDHVYYFKAGNYAQASKDCGGIFKVRFYELSVSHSL